MDNKITSNLRKKYSNKKILIVGLGLQGGGAGVARFFSELGALITVTDKKNEEQLFQSINKLKYLPITFHLGGHHISDFFSADIIFKGPSVPWNLPEIKAAEEKGIPIEMELSFFAQYSPARMIGVTGTRGKSTTTHIIYQLLKDNGFPVYLGGSIPGVSTISLLKTITKNDWIAAELSSWSLGGFHRKKISPHISVFTNFYPDHLNYYKTIEEYLYDKKAIYLYQKKSDFLSANEKLKSVVEKDKPKGQIFYFNKNSFGYKHPYLKGEHNQENLSAALTVAKILRLDPLYCFKTIKSFSGLPMRQQIIGKKEKTVFINDSTSTTPIATIKAIERLAGKKIILILGGNSKNLSFETLINQLIKVEKIVLLAGSFTDEILPKLKEKYPEKITPVFDDLEKATKEAYQLAYGLNNDAYVLFSPGATSFAMFNNEFHRGEEFTKIVKEYVL